MKAFHIDFNWYHLASWINITEQWPYHTTWMILYFEFNESKLEDRMSLYELYTRYVLRAALNTSLCCPELLVVSLGMRRGVFFLDRLTYSEDTSSIV